MRGYFFGVQHTAPIRWSNLSESMFRTLLGIIFISSHLLLPFEGETRGAVSALTMGELISLTLLFIFFAKRIDSHLIDNNGITFENIKNILCIAIPISFSQIVNSISLSVKALLIPKSLVISGLSALEALSVYGKTSGMVLPLLFFPAIFIRALSSNIIPQIARALSLGNIKYAFKLSEQAIFFSSFYSFAVTGFFTTLSRPVAELLFPGFKLGNLIIGFSVGIPFFYIESILIAILRGMGNNITPIITSMTTFFISNGLLYLLAVKTSMGIYGYAFALITASAVAIYISVNNLEQTFDKKFNMMNIILKPLLCCVFMMYILSKTYLPLKALELPNTICIGAALFLGFSGYLILALVLGLDLKSFKH